jgi:hypothetical protein
MDSVDSRAALVNFANKSCAKEAVTSMFLKGRRGSDCLAISKAQEKFFENYGKCSDELWSFCEFINING